MVIYNVKGVVKSMENSIGVLAIIVDETETADKQKIQRVLIEKNSDDSMERWGFPCYFLNEDIDEKDFLVSKIKDFHDVDIQVSKSFGTFKLQDEITVVKNYVCVLGDEGIFSYAENIRWVSKEEIHEMVWLPEQLELANKIYDNWNMLFFNMDKLAGAAKGVAQGVFKQAGIFAEALKVGGTKAKKAVADAKRDLDIKVHKPISLEQFKSNEYKLPDIVYVVEEDKKMNMDIFENAIGHEDTYKAESGQVRMLTLYRQRVENLKLHFYPNLQNTMFYRHPYENGLYISLDEYFNYFQKCKVDELNMIAHCLGAKYVKISLKEEKTSFVSKSKNVKITGDEVKKRTEVQKDGKYSAAVDINKNETEKEFSNFTVISECSYEGSGNPIMPKLNYFRDDADITNLIDMRMNDINSIKSKTYSIKYNSTSGMKVKEAVKIDTILKKLKISGNGSVVSEVEKENRLSLEYHIEF